MIKKISAFLLAFIILISNSFIAFANEINIEFIQNSKIDIILTSKDYNFDSDKFKKDIKERLEEKGLDVNLINVQTIETSQFDMDSSDAKTIINTWMKFPQNKASNWSYNSGGYITSSVNEPYETGFINTTQGYIQNITLDGRLYTNEYIQPMGYIIRMKPQDNNKNRWNMYMLWVSGYNGYKYSSQNPKGSAASGQSYDMAPQRSIVLFKVEGLYIDYNYWKNVQTSGTYAATPLEQTKYANQMVLGWSHHLPRAYGGYPDGTPLVVGTTVTNTTDKSLKTTTLGFCNIPLGSNAQFDLKIEAKGDTMKVYYNDELQFSAIDDSFSEGYYGLFEFSHVSPRFYGINATTENFKSFNDILLAPTWREDADHYIINVDKKEDDSFINKATKGEILTRTINDNIDFIQWGSDENKTIMENFIKQNNDNGTFVNYTNYDTAIEETVNYIVDKYKISQNIEQTILTDTLVEINVTPEKYRTNTTNIEYPNGKWIIHHNYKYYKNNTGQSENAEFYMDSIPEKITFDKPGKYEIYFGDELAQSVFVHRKPIANFDVKLNTDKTVNLTSTSYDLDSDTNIGFGNGIVEEKWQYKKINDDNWISGKPITTLENGESYVFQLQVKDEQGVWSAPISKFITLDNTVSLKPIAQFDFEENKFFIDKELVINDSSYDPAGKNITKYEWTLKKDGKDVGTYTTPITNFSNLGTGNYSYTLKVTNSSNIISDAFTKSFSVIEDKIAPSITVDPTYCDWSNDVDININIEDFDSGLNKWRYCYTQNQNKPEDSLYGAWQTTSSDSLTFNIDGEYYLHVQAVDNSGNSITRTVGPYKITHPYVNKVTHNYTVAEQMQFITFDWGKWYNPTVEFENKIKGFELSDNFMASYPTIGTIYEKSDRLKQPSSSIEYNFSYKPVEYTAMINYGYDEKIETKTFTVLDGFKLERPEREGYEFVNWYINGEPVKSINYNLNNTFDSFEDFKNEMNNRISEDVVITAKWNQTEFVEGTNVYAQIASEYKVTIPKTIVLSGTTKSADYYVKVEGDIAGTETIIVEPDERFILHTPNKNNEEAAIIQDKVIWKYSDFNIDANGNISAPNITAGKWIGTFNFNIEFNSPDKVEKDSEEYIEYKTVEYPQE